MVGSPGAEVAGALELQASLDSGYSGYFTEEGSKDGRKQPISIHFAFGTATTLEGAGNDAGGQFVLSSGQFSAVEVSFTTRYVSGAAPARKFTGQRYPDMSIVGRWSEEGEQRAKHGEFSVSHVHADIKAAPSYDINRVKLYTVLEQLATGGFGVVSRVRRVTDGKTLVWKELNYSRMNKKERRMMITEVNILRDVEHPHIVKYYDTIIVRELQKIYLVIEHCARGDIGAMIEKYKRQLRQMDEPFIWRVMGQILLALHTCHHRDEVILHRDLKPANILLDADYNVKVADFGLACVVSSEMLACSKVGTPLYMSPEQIQGSGYTEKSDIWSLGCILYEMACLKPPFDARNQIELAHCIQNGRFDPLPSDYSQDLHTVIGWMLQQLPEQRPTVDDLLTLAERHDASLHKAAASAPSAPSQHPPGSRAVFSPHKTLSSPSYKAPSHEARCAGMVLEKNKASGRYTIRQILKDSPAARSSHILHGDELLKVDGKDIAGMPADSLPELFRPRGVGGGGSGLHPVCLVLLRRPTEGQSANSPHQATVFVEVGGGVQRSDGTATVPLSPRHQRVSPHHHASQQQQVQAHTPNRSGDSEESSSASARSAAQTQSAGVLGGGEEEHLTARCVMLEQRLVAAMKEVEEVRRAMEDQSRALASKDAALRKSMEREKELLALVEKQSQLIPLHQQTAGALRREAEHSSESPMHLQPSFPLPPTPGRATPTNGYPDAFTYAGGLGTPRAAPDSGRQTPVQAVGSDASGRRTPDHRAHAPPLVANAHGATPPAPHHHPTSSPLVAEPPPPPQNHAPLTPRGYSNQTPYQQQQQQIQQIQQQQHLQQQQQQQHQKLPHHPPTLQNAQSQPSIHTRTGAAPHLPPSALSPLASTPSRFGAFPSHHQESHQHPHHPSTSASKPRPATPTYPSQASTSGGLPLSPRGQPYPSPRNQPPMASPRYPNSPFGQASAVQGVYPPNRSALAQYGDVASPSQQQHQRDAPGFAPGGGLYSPRGMHQQQAMTPRGGGSLTPRGFTTSPRVYANGMA